MTLRTAIISRCEAYRYQLWRGWNLSRGRVVFVGLNPSTADHEHDDATINRCSDFAYHWGFGSLCMINLFAFRAREPEDMLAREWRAVGVMNDWHTKRVLKLADLVICCWGNPGTFMDRDLEVFKMIDKPMCLGVNKNGTPKHPLYLKKHTLFKPYEGR